MIKTNSTSNASNAKYTKYTKVSMLGSGTYGIVYLVKDANGNKYAMKEISLPTSGINATAANEMGPYLHREIKNLKALTDKCSNQASCPIIQHIDHFEDADKKKTIIIMEYANGGDLNDYISDTLTKTNTNLKDDSTILKIKIQLAYEILKGLLFIHEHEIVHGDIKPENILIHDNRVKFSDFGISCMLSPENECTYTAGTMSHLDPRILNGTLQPRQISKETDMYSLGVLLYNLFEVGIFFEGHRTAPIPENFVQNYNTKKADLQIQMNHYKTLFTTKSSYMWNFSDSSKNLHQKASRYYELMIDLLQPYPIKRIQIQDAIRFIQNKDAILPSPMMDNTKQVQVAAIPVPVPVPLQPLTEDDIRKRIQSIVDIVFNDLKAFASSSEIITISQMHEEMKSPINKQPLDNLKPWDNISKLVAEVIETKLKKESNSGSPASTHASFQGGGRKGVGFKKTGKKVRIAGKERCVYIDVKRKRYIKRKGVMVPI